MAKIDIARTELVWPGKYNEDGTLKEMPRVSLPFQVIETVNESRATREATKGGVQGTLFDVYEGKEGDTFEAGWRNKLIWGDNLLVMASLLEKFAGKIDLIYIDPPFATGADFSFITTIGESGADVAKEPSAIEEKAYRDTWYAGAASFYSMMRDRLALMRELLSPTGSIYVHLDYRVVHGVKLIMDELFGVDNFLNHIIWSYNTRTMTTPYFARKHNDILFYKAATTNCFNPDVVRVSHRPESLVQYDKVDEQGRKYKQQSGGARTYLNELGQPCPDVWDIQILGSRDAERTGYETQKPETLLERVILASSNPGNLVADFFCGSGTTLAVAQKLSRRWIGCDLGRWGIHVTRKRLLGIENCKPKVDPPLPVIIAPVQERLAYDIAIPITKPSLEHDIRKLSDLDVTKLDAIHEQEELAEPFRLSILNLEFATTGTDLGQVDVGAGELRPAQELLASITNKVVDRAKLPNRFAELYPAVRMYVATRCFGRAIDPDNQTVRSHLARLDLQEGIAKYLARKIAELTVERRAIEFEKADFKLSETRPFSWRRNLPPFDSERTVFNYVATYNNFERRFAQFLSKAEDVLRFASLGTTEQGESGTQFRIDYLKPSGAVGFYHPDWAVVQKTKKGEVNWIIETKGRVWEGTTAKDDAMTGWCERVSAAIGRTWRYRRVDQRQFDPSKASSLSSLFGEDPTLFKGP